jgi:hypothetical protein
MRVFLDFEASSLSDASYPIEAGWAGEDGSCETHLIRPAPGWTDWDPTAEAIHGLSRARLIAEGEPHDAVARHALEALAPHEVFVSAPSWDGKWMSVLLRAAGLPRHGIRFHDSDAAHRAAVLEALGEVPPDEIDAVTALLIADARRAVEPPQPAHRALPDAQTELAVWREVRSLAERLAGR